MKKFLTIAAVVVACAVSGAVEMIALKPGVTNACQISGKVIAMRAVTGDETGSVSVKVLQPWSAYTNAVSTVTTTQTNYVVCSSNEVTASTNLLAFATPTWNQRVWLDERIIWIATNSVSTTVTNMATLLSDHGVTESTLATASVSDHVGRTNITGKVLFGNERLYMSGSSGAGDLVTIAVER